MEKTINIRNNNIFPLVSIIIPSYNKAELLIEMIESIIKQTYRKWELIIVDDGSESDNIEKIQSFIKADRRCQLVRRDREPKNGDTCRNIGMELAQGEYIIIFDSDDLITPNCIENRVRFMMEHPSCDYASFPYAEFNNGDDINIQKAKRIIKVVPDDEILSNLLKVDYPFTVWSNIYRSDSVKEIRWDEKVLVYQDFDFMVNCAVRNLRHEYCNGSIDYFYRQFNDGSNVCGNFVSKEKCYSTLYLFDKTLNLINGFSLGVNRKEQFKEFILVQLERLLLNGQKQDSYQLAEMCRKHYDEGFVMKMNSIIGQFKRRKSSTFNYVRLYMMLYHEFGIEKYNIKKRLVNKLHKLYVWS